VTHLSYGVEDSSIDLEAAARLREEPTEQFTAMLRWELDKGCSLAAAQGAARAACLGNGQDAASALWEQPNLILALCYHRALLRLNSPLQPLPVKRQGGYHDAVLPVADAAAHISGSLPESTHTVYPSATAVRHAYLSGDISAAEAACGYVLPAAGDVQPVCRPNALDSVLLYRLRAMTPEQLQALPLCTEGLEHRMTAAVHQATSRETLLEALKTKRYARAGLSRLCTHGLLDVTQELLEAHPLPEYVRLLGFRKESAHLLSCLRESSIPVISKAADGNLQNPLYALDNTAYDLWALGAGLPAGLMMRSQVVRFSASEQEDQR
jgi:predicted nucleotidyltransferase